MIYLLLLLLLIILYMNIPNNEHFQYIMYNTPIDYIHVRDNNKIFKTRVADNLECDRMCSNIIGCQGYNHALNDCTLYKNLQYVAPPRRPYLINF